VLRKLSGLKREDVRGAGRNSIMMSFLICIPQQIIRPSNQRAWHDFVAGIV